MSRKLQQPVRPENPQCGVTRHLRRAVFLTAGYLCVALGVVGLILPVMPTTPFLLAAAWCFFRGSPRIYHWLTTNRWFGAFLLNYREGRGMRSLHKATALLLLWLAIGHTAYFAVSALWLRLLLVLIAVAVTVHLLLIKTYRPGAPAGEARLRGTR